MFYAPANPMNLDEPINYDYASIGEDVPLLQTNEQNYCLKQCYKMAYYISKLYNKEVLRMRCEFMKDDNDTIWFSYASRVIMRPVKSHKEAAKEVKRVKYINKQHQK